jgi:hypothetical protein
LVPNQIFKSWFRVVAVVVVTLNLVVVSVTAVVVLEVLLHQQCFSLLPRTK